MNELNFMDTKPIVKGEDSITVSQLNNLAKTLLENNMPIFWIKGEISGLKTYKHAYFDLKDESCKISCVIFSSVLASCDFRLEHGQQVEVRGKITIYPANGSYQINVERIRSLGSGALWEAYHRLVSKLRLEGLFAENYKKPIPILPRAIGVITSKEGSVIRDVITTLRRRTPNIPIIIYHTAVQGSDAGMQITKAIQLANVRLEVDVLIVCRGGGSMQDLWCFNEEVVAREVFASSIPIISAIGHETDTTIIDFVADLRAATPTAAAELVAKSATSWLTELNKLHLALQTNTRQLLNYKQQYLDILQAKLKLANPNYKVREHINNCINTTAKLHVAMNRLELKHKRYLELLISKLTSKRPNVTSAARLVNYLRSNLDKQLHKLISAKLTKLDKLNSQLILLNPQNILLRGYAIIRNEHGNVITSIKQVADKDSLELIVSDGSFKATVDKNTKKYQQKLL